MKNNDNSVVQSSLIPSLKESIFNNSIKDVSMDLTELGIDELFDESVFSEVPIVKTMMAICKTGIAIRERNLLKQTLVFIKSFNEGNLSEKQKDEYRQKIEENPEFAEKELGRVLILLNANIEEIKSIALGRLFCAFVKGAISWDKFCEYSEANSRMFAMDYDLLNKLFSNNLNFSKEDKYRIGRLIALGMVVEKDSPAANKSVVEQFYSTYNSSKELGKFLPHSDYQITSFGNGFMHIVHEKNNYIISERDENY